MGNGFSQIFQHLSPENLVAFVMIVAVIVMIFLGIMVMFLLTAHRTLDQVSPDLRKMAPGLVWLNLIPYFQLVWSFILVKNISESVGGEFERRKLQTFEEKPGFAVGMAWASLNLLSTLLGFADMPFISLVISLSAIVCWVLFWVKLSRLKADLAGSGTWQQQAQANVAFQYNQQYYQQQNPYANPQGNYPPPNYPAPPTNYPPPPQNPSPQYWQPPGNTGSGDPYPPSSQDDLSRWSPKRNDPPQP